MARTREDGKSQGKVRELTKTWGIVGVKIWPGKTFFVNVTAGVSQHKWLAT